jgi:hypothetical protein
MKKNLWAGAERLLKLALLILFCSFVSIIESAQVSYAISSKTLASAAAIPTVIGILPTPKPQITPNPTPEPTLTPTPAATQPPKATPTPQPQISLVPTATMLPQSPVTVITPTVVVTATSVVSITPTIVVTATPSSAKLTLPVSRTLPMQNGGDQGNALVVFLMLGVGAPLLLISGGGIWWFLVRQKTNQNVPVWHEVTRANSWTNSYTQQSSFYAHQSTSDLMPLAQAAGASSASSMPTSPIQPMYTPSRFRPVTTAFPSPMLTAHAREEATSPFRDDLQSFQIGSLDLSLNATRAIEANGNGQMPLHLAPPTTLVDTPTSSMPSSPPATSALPVASLRH